MSLTVANTFTSAGSIDLKCRDDRPIDVPYQTPRQTVSNARPQGNHANQPHPMETSFNIPFS